MDGGRGKGAKSSFLGTGNRPIYFPGTLERANGPLPLFTCGRAWIMGPWSLSISRMSICQAYYRNAVYLMTLSTFAT